MNNIIYNSKRIMNRPSKVTCKVSVLSEYWNQYAYLKYLGRYKQMLHYRDYR